MSDSPPDRVGEGPRRDYVSMAALARSLLEVGKSHEVILLTCYGVHFPEETLALAELIADQRDELAAGRSTILGFQRDLKDGAVATRYGDSLASVIHADCADTVRRAEKEYASPYNQGAGSIDKYEVDAARADLACAEELIRRVAERRRPKLVP